MKITFIHGENQVISRERFVSLRNLAQAKGFKTVPLTFPPSISLFAEKLVYTIDGLEKIEPRNLAWLTKNFAKYDFSLLVYGRGMAPARIVKALPAKTKVEQFDLPKRIFVLLEAFYPGNGKRFLLLIREVVKHEPIEFVFSLLSRQARDLFWVKVDPESLTYPNWRLAKIKKQASYFTKEQLRQIINSLAEIDLQVKTSQGELLDLLDLLVLTKLE